MEFDVFKIYNINKVAKKPVIFNKVTKKPKIFSNFTF